MKNFHLLSICLLLILSSCSKNDVLPPPFNYDSNLNGTLPIPDSTMRYMEGIYNKSDGSDKLGVEFVCKVSKNRVSFFSNQSGIFMIMKYGFNPVDSSIQFSGFWRYSQTPDQGNIGFSISKSEGSMELIQNKIADNMKIQVSFLDVDLISRSSTINFSRHFTDYTKNKGLIIFAHHGNQTTANPPYADNSINAILYSEEYGVNGIELDVRMTKDNVPILIHDATINTRLTLKGPLTGNYDQYNFSVLSDYVRLRDGQKIPSVEEALNAFIEKTNLKYIELDIKGNVGIFKYLEPIIINANAHAVALGRDVEIITDLPSQDVIDEYQNYLSQTPTSIYRTTLITMCDVSLQATIDNGCEYWTPRYSEGLLLPEIEQAHALGIKVGCWTLNDRNLIRNYLINGNFDSLESDYPAYIVYDFYTLF